MEIFSVIVAVSLTMFLFSSLSSMLVELINRRLNTRSRKLNDMLHTFYEEELKPYAKNEEQGAADKFVRDIDKKDSKEQISTLDFMRSLAQTDIGYRIYNNIEKDAQYFFDDIAYRFEEFGERYSEYYRQHARRMNIWVSIFLAFAMNINLITIVDSLQYRNGVSEAFVQKAVSIVNEQPNTTNIANFQSVLAEINSLRVPYGWPKQPFINNQAKPFDLGAYIIAFRDSIFMGVGQFGLGWLIWIVTTLITGMLIGLGSPFWFDVLKRLFSFSKVANLMFSANKNIAKDNQPKHRAPEPWEVFERSIQAKEAQQSLLAKINTTNSADNT
ncbi:hypothetical protein [Pseudoalteromonas luteoviolacea]|uniref:Uncharacterized protein n=1 Tax=Pseudoalteromonas luteoviolacea NCIMB 1942 TaxID=1365253 RepID=A0A166Z658_9GAMM|nr:hypothetical protein [Pseudoalteromonas luteoviolacea]KZN43976.1 hypothetical protein N482_18255 [Pseudoalteromonas luteoviolacea NCIMB 1942]